jgi:type IV pilus assembly protein PilX
MRTMIPQSERGAVLIVTLILLFVITILAVSEVSFNSILTRIATNTADAQVAFQTAEGVLNQAANQVLTGGYTLNDFTSNTAGLYLFNANNAPLWTSVSWTGSGQVVQSYQGNSNVQGAYIIEQLPSVTLPGQSMSKPTAIYRITSRAVGASGSGAVIMQAIVQVPQ